MTKAPQQMNGTLQQIIGDNPQLSSAMGMINNSPLGKKKAPTTPAEPAAAPLQEPTWAASNMSPEARGDLLRVMMQRARSGSTPTAAAGKGAQAVPPAGGA